MVASLRSVTSQIFWFVATLDLAVSVGFAVLVSKVPTPELSPSHFTLSRSQRKDNWLGCAMIWVVLFSEGWPLRDALLLAGAMVLAWLTQRTVYRLRSIQGTKR